MTQSNETTQQLDNNMLVPTNVPFNLIIATSPEQVKKIAKHFDLSDVRLVDSLKLPPTGAKRGDALNELLGKVEHTVTLAVIIDSPWASTLLNSGPMASMVWRSVESQLLGHRTNGQRNLIVLATSFEGGVREAEDKGQLISIVAGAPLLQGWKPERKVEAKKPEAKKANVKPQGEKKAQGDKSGKVKNATKSGAVTNQEGFKMADGGKGTYQGKKPQLIDRSKKTKGPRPAGSNQGLHDDLYLLCKGHYGTCVDIAVFLDKARKVIAHHTGFGGVIGTDMVVSHLFRTLIAKSSRGYWGGFNVLQNVIEAGAQSPEELASSLNGYIATIPAVDAQGKEIPQPKMQQSLYGKLNVVAEKIEAPVREEASA